jgi:hypothetical protein
MKVIGEETPRQARGLGFRHEAGQAPYAVLPIVIAQKDGPLFNPPHDDVLEETRCIEAGTARHEGGCITSDDRCKVAPET